MSATTDTANNPDVQLQRKTLNGVEYFVAPVVAIREGVYMYPRNNGRGIKREFLPAEEIANTVSEWEGKPLTLRHPEDSEGRAGLITNPDTEHTEVGLFRNVTNKDSALIGETWIEIDEVGDHGGELESYINGLRSGKPQEVSTGYRAGTEFERGSYENQRYTHVQRKPQPDHLALLTRNRGNCSVDEGCGAGAVLNNAPVATDGGVRVNNRRATENALTDALGVVEDMRGSIHVMDQTSDGSSVQVEDAHFEDTDYFLCAHLLGTRYPDIGPGLGPSLGEIGPFDAGSVESDVEIPLDDELDDDSVVFVALHYSEDGEKGEHIPASRHRYYVDSTFVAVVDENVDMPDEMVMNEDIATTGYINEMSEPSGVLAVDEGSPADGESDTAFSLLKDIRAKLNQLVGSAEEPTGDLDDGQASTGEKANESGGEDADTANRLTMEDTERERLIKEVTNQSAITRESLEGMGDTCLQTTHESVVNSDSVEDDDDDDVVNEANEELLSEVEELRDTVNQLQEQREEERSRREQHVNQLLKDGTELGEQTIEGMDLESKENLIDDLGVSEQDDEPQVNMAGIPKDPISSGTVEPSEVEDDLNIPPAGRTNYDQFKEQSSGGDN